MIRIFLVASLVALVGCGKRPATASASPDEIATGAEIVIADGRMLNEPPAGNLPEALSDAAMAAVFAAARAHWQPTDPAYEEDARVLAVAAGSFTEVGAGQRAVLYVMSLWPRCCPKLGVAVFNGEMLTRNVAFEGTFQNFRTVPDLDGDGLDEVAAIGGFGMGGENSTSVSLFSFAGAGLVSFGGAMLAVDNCAGNGSDPGTANRITARAGSPPSATIESFRRASCTSTVWDPVGPPEPLPLEAEAMTFVVLK